MTWLDREREWLLDGKNVYLSRQDEAGVAAFTSDLDRHGVAFVIETTAGAVIFSYDRVREWWATASEAA
jgi:hypothetical protein